MVITIIILVLIILILGYAVRNLLKKNEACEDTILYYEKYISNISDTIEFAQEELTKIDNKGSFESDDEVGFFFKGLKNIQEQLNEFNLNKK